MAMYNIYLMALVVAALQIAPATGAETTPAHDHANADELNEKSVMDDRADVSISVLQQQKAGVQTQVVKREKLIHKIRTLGSITTDQTREAHIHTRISGWIEKVHVDYVGKSVTKGSPLFDLYSPDLVSTQEEYLTAKRQGQAAADVAEAALNRLRLWGVAEQELTALQSATLAKKTMTFYAPVSGVVIRKAAITGAYITPDAELYYLADIGQVWLLLTLYEGDIANEDHFLRPGMFANAEIEKTLTEQIVVSEDAVLDTGQRKIVFVKMGDQAFVPREVTVGQRVGEQLAILAGLNEGEAVVVSASFLIDAESRLQAALRKGKPSTAGHSGHGDTANKNGEE